MYRHCHGAITLIVFLICCCSKTMCEQRTSNQVDLSSQSSNNAKSFLASDLKSISAESLPSKGYLIDLNRPQTSLSGADRDLVAVQNYDREESTLSYLTDMHKREKSREIDMKTFPQKKLALLRHMQKFRIVVNDSCIDHSWWRSLDINLVFKFFEYLLKNSFMEIHGDGNVWCRWYLNFKNSTNPPELMFRTLNVSRNVKSGMRRNVEKPYLKPVSAVQHKQSVSVNIIHSLVGIPPNIEQGPSVFRPIPRRNATVVRQKRSHFRHIIGLFHTPKSLPVGDVETTVLNSNTTELPNDVTNPSSEIDDEIAGLSRENFLVVISSFALIGLGAAGLVAFLIRRHRRRNDPEYQRLLSVKIVTGIYYNQTGVCF